MVFCTCLWYSDKAIRWWQTSTTQRYLYFLPLGEHYEFAHTMNLQVYLQVMTSPSCRHDRDCLPPLVPTRNCTAITAKAYAASHTKQVWSHFNRLFQSTSQQQKQVPCSCFHLQVGSRIITAAAECEQFQRSAKRVCWDKSNSTQPSRSRKPRCTKSSFSSPSLTGRNHFPVYHHLLLLPRSGIVQLMGKSSAVWSAAQELSIADRHLGEMPKFRAQLYRLTSTSVWVVNSAPFFLLSELVSVLTCLSILSPRHLPSRGSPQLDFSSLASFAGGRKWDSTDSARLHSSTSCERIWLPVSFPLKFSKSHRQCMLLHIQATRKKKKN